MRPGDGTAGADGSIVERRRGTRARNDDLLALLDEARTIFGPETERDGCLIIEPIGESGEDHGWVMAIGVATIISWSSKTPDATGRG